jgi:hypothetical protein
MAIAQCAWVGVPLMAHLAGVKLYRTAVATAQCYSSNQSLCWFDTQKASSLVNDQEACCSKIKCKASGGQAPGSMQPWIGPLGPRVRLINKTLQNSTDGAGMGRKGGPVL